VHHGGEQVLEVDAFGQAVGGDQDPPFPRGLAHGLDALARSSGVYSPVTASMRALGILAAAVGHVVGGGDVAAEDDGAEAVPSRASTWWDERGSLGSPAWPESRLGLGDQALQAGGILELRRRLQVVPSRSSAS
jgi:hypothetical protein